MTRSAHTDPREIRAARRVRAPYAPRRDRDPRRDHPLLRALKVRGIRLEPASGGSGVGGFALPRIVVGRAGEGRHHPAGKAEIAAVLRYFGEACVYGIRSIELRRGAPDRQGLHFGRLVVPGRILLDDLPLPPWHLPGRLRRSEMARLERAGAAVERRDGATLVAWPGETLRDFVLFDVLMHEIGHHLLQHHKGKRTARVARTRDHEAFARRFAERCRAAFTSATAVR